MDKSAKIKQALREIVGASPNLPISGTVESIQNDTVSVKLVSGLVLDDVRLNATSSEHTDFMLLTPAIGSEVLLLSVDGTLNNLVVVKMDKVQSFAFSKDGLKIEFDGTDKKVKIENDTLNLKDLFQNLATIISGLKVQVITEGAPSGVPMPDTQSAISQFQASINQLLK